MPSPFDRFVQRTKLSTQRLTSPAMEQEQQQQDSDPNNISLINRELARSPHPRQQEILMNEKQRLEAMQLQQVQQASQQFAPRLQQSLDIQTHTGMPLEGPADKLIKLLLMLKKNPLGQQNQFGVNPQPMPNANPAGGPYNPLLGGFRG